MLHNLSDAVRPLGLLTATSNLPSLQNRDFRGVGDMPLFKHRERGVGALKAVMICYHTCKDGRGMKTYRSGGLQSAGENTARS